MNSSGFQLSKLIILVHYERRNQSDQRGNHMSAIGWIFIVLAFGLVLGSLFMLRDSASKFRISDKKMKKIQQRKAEVEAEESAEDREN